MNRPCFRWAYFAVLAIAIVASISTNGCKKPALQPSFALPVVAAPVIVRDQPIYVENIGQTLGAQDVEIRARVAGFLESVNFVEGTSVAKGTLLYTIDDAPFKTALAQAQGVLAQAEAAWRKSILDTNRLAPLWEKNAISRQQLDDSFAAERSAAANLQAAKAAADAAKIQLDYTKIVAPIDGIVGKTEFKPGNLVGQGQTTLLTTMSSVDPIHVRFSVSEQVYLKWKREHGERLQQSRKAAAGIFELVLADGTIHPHRGSVAFADRQIDPRTGTLLMDVAFPNPEKVVRPGQFGRVRFPSEIVTNAVLILQRSVQELQASFSVFVVTPDNKAEFRKVELGPRVDPFYVVRSGLNAGEHVVIEGIQKLQNGVPVTMTMTNLATRVEPPH